MLQCHRSRALRNASKEHSNHTRLHLSTSLSILHVKHRTENLKKCGTVHHIHCEQCAKDYVGETSRLSQSRVKEHLSRNSSAVHEHCQLTGHSVDSSKTKVLATESNTFKRRIREAIEIQLRKTPLNRDNGFELVSIYGTI